MAVKLSTRTQTRLIRTLLLALLCFIVAFVWLNVRRKAQENVSPTLDASATPSPEPSVIYATATPDAPP